MPALCTREPGPKIRGLFVIIQIAGSVKAEVFVYPFLALKSLLGTYSLSLCEV